MVARLSILMPLRQPVLEVGQPFPPEAKAEMDLAISRMREMVAPLVLVDRSSRLKRELDRIAPEYLHLRNIAGLLLADTLGERAGEEILRAYEGISALVEQDTIVLSVRDKKLLSGVLESLSALLRAASDPLASETRQLQMFDILFECRDALVLVDVCMFAVVLVLAEELEHWKGEGMHLLCRAADENMLEVEDTFLAHSIELSDRLQRGEQSFDVIEARRRVGLSG